MLNSIYSYFEKISKFINLSISLADNNGKIIATTDKTLAHNNLPINIIISLSCEEQFDGNTHLIKKITLENDEYFIVAINPLPEHKSFIELVAYNVSMLLEVDSKSNIIPITFEQYLKGQVPKQQFIERLTNINYNFESKKTVILLNFIDEGIAFAELKETIAEMLDNENLIIFALDVKQIIIIYDEVDEVSADEIGIALLSLIEDELCFNVRVVIGPTVYDTIDIMDSYIGAKSILSISSAFDTSLRFLNYDSLIWTKLISNIPLEIAKDFIDKVVPNSFDEEFEQEYKETIICFFENNLNISETARKLYIHRNTLVYRIEKIKKLTALDISNFEQAVKLYFSIMLKQFIEVCDAKMKHDTEAEK